MNHCFYCLDGLWNVKAKYIVLCLNALAKLQNPKGVSRPPALMGYYSVVCISAGGAQNSKTNNLKLYNFRIIGY